MDIRSWLGGKPKTSNDKPIPKEAIEKSPKKKSPSGNSSKVSKAPISSGQIDDILIDSDDENVMNKSKGSKRLRVSKDKQPSFSPHKGNKIELIEEDVISPSKRNKSGQSQHSINLSHSQVTDRETQDLSQEFDSPIDTTHEKKAATVSAPTSTEIGVTNVVPLPLKLMERNNTKVNENLKPVVGGAFTYFGDKPTIEPAVLSDSNITNTDKQDVVMIDLNDDIITTITPEKKKSKISSPVITTIHSTPSYTTPSHMNTTTTSNTSSMHSPPSASSSIDTPNKRTTNTTTTKSTSTYYRGHSADGGAPLREGTIRQPPNGIPECLKDMKIAITGVFNSFSRDEMEDFVLKYGGKVAGSVSGKTNILVRGKILEDGRKIEEGSKYKHAMEKKVKILSEDEFIDMIQLSNPNNEYIDWNIAHPLLSSSITNTTTSGNSRGSILKDNSYIEHVTNASTTSSSTSTHPDANSDKVVQDIKSSLLFPTSTPIPTTTTTTTNKAAPSGYHSTTSYLKPGTSTTANKPTSSSSSYNTTTSNSHSHSSSNSSNSAVNNSSDMLWVDKYKPQSSSDIIGCNDTVKKLSDWLKSWKQVHIEKSRKIPFTKENPGAKAVLLSGPPGIGKTTLATLISKEMGYEVLELNASDTRSKKAITEQLADVVVSNAIAMNGTSHKRLVIMDEVDGMGGSDRGGIPELMKVIKSSKSPIICICNDRQCQKIRSLANSCYDLRVRRPTKGQIAQRAIQIAQKEGLHIDSNAAEILVEQMGNDIRQVINCLQMWRAQSQVLRYEDMKSRMASLEKDKILRQSPFDACQLILSAGGGGSSSSSNKISFDERYNSFFIDYALVPLLIQQNYIESSKNGIFKSTSGNDVFAMEQLAKAADAVSDMDLAESSIRGQDQHWELLPTEAAFSVAVGTHIRGFQGFPSFPAWLGKNSTTGKNRRLTHEIVTHTALSIGQGFLSIRLEYIPYLRSFLLKPLLSSQKDNQAVENVIHLLDSYGLSRDDFLENMKELQLVHEKDVLLKDYYAPLESTVKSTLTRLYNQMEHRSQALASDLAMIKKGGGKKAATGGISSSSSSSRFGDDGDEIYDEEGEGEGGLGTIEDLAASKAVDDTNGEDDDMKEASAFMKKSKNTSKSTSNKSNSVKNNTSSSSAKKTTTTTTAGKGKRKN